MDGPAGSFTDSDLPGHQGRIVFAALALERRRLARDQLADLVWDDNPPAQWSGALTAVASKIRSLITGIGLDGSEVMQSSGGTYALALPAGTFVDWEVAVRRLDRADGALRHGDHVSAAEDSTVASSILRRPMLVGADCLWAERVRDRQSDALYRCLITLARAWLALANHRLAAIVASDAIDVDPLRETAHRLLVEAELGAGDRAAALRALTCCELMLTEELGVEPSEETMQLAARVRGTTR